MSESVATTQVEEVNNAASEKVQEEPVSSEYAPEDNEASNTDEVSKTDDNSVDPIEKAETEPEKKEVSEETAEVVSDEKTTETTETTDDKVATNGAEHSEETNGKDAVDDAANNNQEAEVKPDSEPAVEETNGVCKRKVPESETEVAADEKSPKKAKVVEDGDQAPVEETAA